MSQRLVDKLVVTDEEKTAYKILSLQCAAENGRELTSYLEAAASYTAKTILNKLGLKAMKPETIVIVSSTHAYLFGVERDRFAVGVDINHLIVNATQSTGLSPFKKTEHTYDQNILNPSTYYVTEYNECLRNKLQELLESEAPREVSIYDYFPDVKQSAYLFRKPR